MANLKNKNQLIHMKMAAKATRDMSVRRHSCLFEPPDFAYILTLKQPGTLKKKHIKTRDMGRSTIVAYPLPCNM